MLTHLAKNYPDRTRRRVDLELGKQPPRMVADGMNGNAQDRGNLLGRNIARKQFNDLIFSWG